MTRKEIFPGVTEVQPGVYEVKVGEHFELAYGYDSAMVKYRLFKKQIEDEKPRPAFVPEPKRKTGTRIYGI